jgi:predicted O-methyltransferase YrrM
LEFKQGISGVEECGMFFPSLQPDWQIFPWGTYVQQIAELIRQALASGEELDYFGHIKGFLHPLEGYTLMLLAAMGQGRGEVVEIGSYLGKSTSYLALGLKAGNRGIVHAVDHFQGSDEHQKGQRHEESVLVQEGTLLHEFKRNMELNELQDHVRPIVSDSLSAGRSWNGPIRLLFIDGDHSYEATKADFECWERHVIPDGLIAFHDVGDSWPGVTTFFNELITEGAHFLTLAVGSIRVVKKRRIEQ